MKNNWLEIVTKNLTLLVFIAFLGVLYIANAHIQFTNLSSEVEKKVEATGLKRPRTKPKVIKKDES